MFQKGGYNNFDFMLLPTIVGMDSVYLKKIIVLLLFEVANVLISNLNMYVYQVTNIKHIVYMHKTLYISEHPLLQHIFTSPFVKWIVVIYGRVARQETTKLVQLIQVIICCSRGSQRPPLATKTRRNIQQIFGFN